MRSAGANNVRPVGLDHAAAAAAVADEPAAVTSTRLFTNRVKVYPKKVDGTIRRIKWAVLVFCLAVYYVAPWIRWDRGFGRPGQAILIDMPNRRGYFFWIEIWPQEVYYLAGLMILGAVALFFVTSLFGRLWCGYACPQTVWTDLFIWAERLIEGDRTQRIRLDAQPLSFDKARRKLLKHSIWLAIAAATGGAWIMYFNDAPTVVRDVFTLQASSTVYAFIGLFTATTYLLAGWAREQVCTYMCPWPRFQSAMVDEQTLTVTYRDWRGEPRGKLKQAPSEAKHGDCIDCKACVVVCPTGIDIRDGLQLECIGCGLCIDACDEIMDRVDRPRGLIAFDTYANHEARARGETPRYRLLRPRTMLYVAVLSVGVAVMLTVFAMRTTLEVSVLPDRSPLFVTLHDGSIRNTYTLKIANHLPQQAIYRVAIGGLPGAALSIAGGDAVGGGSEDGVTVAVPADSIGTFRAYVHADRGAAQGGEAKLTFDVFADHGAVAHGASTFHAPASDRPSR